MVVVYMLYHDKSTCSVAIPISRSSYIKLSNHHNLPPPPPHQQIYRSARLFVNLHSPVSPYKCVLMLHTCIFPPANLATGIFIYLSRNHSRVYP